MFKKFITIITLQLLAILVSADPIVSQHCEYVEAAEILNPTHGKYGALFTGGNHQPYFDSSAGSADIYRLLKGKNDVRYRKHALLYGHTPDKTKAYEGFNWILERSKSRPNDWYAEAFIAADLNNVVEHSADPWVPLDAKEKGKEFLTWLSFTIKSSAAPWNYMPMYAAQHQQLWNTKYNTTFTQILQRYNHSKDLSWYVLATELAFPGRSYPALRKHYEELSDKVSTCSANNAEYAAWALSSLKFEQSDFTSIQMKFLPDQLLVNKTVSLTRKLAHELALDVKLQSNRETLEILSTKLPAQAVSLYPIVPLLYLTPQDKLAAVVNKITSSKNSTSDYVQRLTYNHLSKRLNGASTDVIEQIYNAVHDNSVALKSRLRGVLAARYFLDSEYDKSLTVMADIIMEGDRKGAKDTASYGMTYFEHFLAEIPIEAKAASLVLALHSVSNWPSYHQTCFNCNKSKKDIPKWLLSKTQNKKDNEIYLKQLLGDPTLATWYLTGNTDDSPLTRARNTNREDIRGSTWYENKQYDLVPYELHKAAYQDLTPIMNKSSEIILKWASEGNKSWRRWLYDPAKSHKAAALNALIYASKTNPSVGLVKNPSREAWLLIEDNFSEFKHFKYWYSPSSDNYIRDVGCVKGAWLAPISNAGGTITRQCSISNFQQCYSCEALSCAVDLEKPNAGDYYRGAHWNGLYKAYVLNCPDIGQILLDYGASPVTGGYEGLLIYAVTRKWPHDDETINSKWVDLLLKNGAAMDTPLEGLEGPLTTTQKLKKIVIPQSVDYPHLLKKFTNK